MYNTFKDYNLVSNFIEALRRTPGEHREIIGIVFREV